MSAEQERIEAIVEHWKDPYKYLKCHPTGVAIVAQEHVKHLVDQLAEAQRLRDKYLGALQMVTATAKRRGQERDEAQRRATAAEAERDFENRECERYCLTMMELVKHRDELRAELERERGLRTEDTKRIEAWEEMNRRGIRPGAAYDPNYGLLGWDWSDARHRTWRESMDAAMGVAAEEKP